MSIRSNTRPVPPLPLLVVFPLLVTGCYLHHERDLDASATEPDSGAADADGAPDAPPPPPPPCTTTCPAPVLLGERRYREHDSDPVPWAILGVAATGDAAGVLIAENREEPFEHSHIVLWVRTPDGRLRKSPDSGGLSINTVIEGLLVARPASFVAAFLSWREFGDPWVGLRLSEWALDGTLLRTEDLLELPFLAAAGCRDASRLPCEVRASMRLRDETVEVAIVDESDLFRARVDLGSWSVATLPSAPLPERRRVGEPVSALSDASDTSFAAMGGPGREVPPTPAVLAVFHGVGSSEVTPLPGVVQDPPAVLGLLDGEATVWRFVTDPERAIDSAIHGWRLADTTLSESDWIAPTPMGFAPAALAVVGSGGAEGAGRATVVWASADPSDPELSSLHVLRLRSDFEGCERLQAATAAGVPWPLNDYVRAMAAAPAEGGAGVIVAVLGDETAGDPLALLHLPQCE